MSEYQFTYNGLSFGANTDIDVEQVQGLDSLAIPLSLARLPRYHGAIVGDSYASHRSIGMQIWLNAANASALADIRETVYEALQPSVSDELPLVFEFPGEGTTRVECRLADRAGVRMHDGEFGAVFRLDVRFEASDPAIYSNAETNTNIAVFAASEGLSYPVTYPKQYGASGSGAGTTLTNSGKWISWPRLTIQGPSSGTLTDPLLENVTTGETIKLTANGGAAINAGQSLVIETHPVLRSIQFTTGASRYGKLSNDSVFWGIEPGDNEIRFRASGNTTGAVLNVRYRSAWI